MTPLARSWIRTGIVLLIGLAPLSAKAANTYYVAPNGSDSAAGTMAAPFATLQKANDTAAAGDTIYLRAGTYNCTAQITLSKSGTSDTNRTNIFAYTGEVPVLDFSNFTLASETSDHPAITVTGSWMHLRGLEIANGKVGTSGSHSYSMLRTKNASNNTFELLNIHNGFGPGLFIDTGTGGNMILNCDSHDNYDVNGSQGDGQNADGFGVHYQTTGPSTIIKGCRAWNNSDDGYDLISQEVPVTVENNWAFKNGHGTEGNGNGFKMGSSQTGIRHLVQQNVAWSNAESGFYANHSTGGNTWYNNTSFMNGTQYNMLASPAGDPDTTITLTGSLVHIMRNNIGYPNKNTNMTGVDTMFNTWDLGITPAAKDFASITDPSVSMTGVGVESSGALGPRAADGSMPPVDFLQLAAGSQMIDKGTDVGLPYVGAAPDLGAYEYGAGGTTGSAGAGGTTTTGTGGAGTGGTGGGAAGGSSGSAGRAGTGGGAGGGTVTGNGGSGTSGTGGLGGSSATGGASATGGSNATGGSTASGGSSATGGSSADAGNAASGCACALDAPSASASWASLLAMLGGLSFLLAGRRRRQVTARK
jgi:hypothetical protein